MDSRNNRDEFVEVRQKDTKRHTNRKKVLMNG